MCLHVQNHFFSSWLYVICVAMLITKPLVYGNTCFVMYLSFEKLSGQILVCACILYSYSIRQLTKSVYSTASTYPVVYNIAGYIQCHAAFLSQTALQHCTLNATMHVMISG